jgi:hypothetical protein
MSILGSRANEVFWDMAKCGNLNNTLYKKSLKFLNLKRCKGKPQSDMDSVSIRTVDKVLLLQNIEEYQEKFEIQLLGVTCDDTGFT